MDHQLIVSFLVAALAIQAAPGPGMLFIVANGVAGGPRGGIAAAFGAACGMVVHTFAAAFGLAALFAYAPPLFDAVKIAGCIYLLVLAFRTLRRRGSALSVESAERVSPRRVFVRAAMNNLANPKVITFYAMFLPQFVDRSIGHVTLQFVALGLVFLIIGLLLDIVIGMFAGSVGAAVTRRPRVDYVANKLVGSIFAVLGLRLLTMHRPASP